MKEFAARAPSTRNICFDYSTPMSNSSLVERPGYKTWRNAEHNQCLLRHLGCIPMSNYRGMRNGLRFYRLGRVLKEYDCVASPAPVLRNKDEELPFCYIHFQGSEHKEIMYIYARAIELTVRGCSSSKLVQSNATTIYASPDKKGREVYAILHGTKRKLHDGEVRNLAPHAPIIKNVPLELIEFFPNRKYI